MHEETSTGRAIGVWISYFTIVGDFGFRVIHIPRDNRMFRANDHTGRLQSDINPMWAVVAF